MSKNLSIPQHRVIDFFDSKPMGVWIQDARIPDTIYMNTVQSLVRLGLLEQRSLTLGCVYRKVLK